MRITYEQSQPFTLVDNGSYEVEIVDVQEKESTTPGWDDFMATRFEVLGPAFTGATLYANISLRWTPKTKLGELLRALGISGNLGDEFDTSTLIGTQCVVVVETTPDTKQPGAYRNNIVQFLPIGTAVGAAPGRPGVQPRAQAGTGGRQVGPSAREGVGQRFAQRGNPGQAPGYEQQDEIPPGQEERFTDQGTGGGPDGLGGRFEEPRGGGAGRSVPPRRPTYRPANRSSRPSARSTARPSARKSRYVPKGKRR